MNDTSGIRSYSLFGETAELADVLHAETIESRSRLHDWQLKPHRHGRLHQFLFLTGGGGTASIDGKSLPLQPPCLVNLPRTVVHGFRFDPGTAGWVVTLTPELLDYCTAAGEGVRAALDHAQVLPMDPDLQALTGLLAAEYAGQGFGRAQMLRSLAGALMARAARAIQATQAPADGGRSKPLFRRFTALVERDFRTRRPLAGYARELAVSATHLNRITHQATGHSASQLLNERMLREARRLLIYTNLTAAQVAYELGFTDPAHFSRVFARGTGLPPRAFRQQVAGED